jgi:hypothetical protein
VCRLTLGGLQVAKNAKNSADRPTVITPGIVSVLASSFTTMTDDELNRLGMELSLLIAKDKITPS